MNILQNHTVRGALAGLFMAAALVTFGIGWSLAQDAGDNDLEAFLSESEPPAFEDQGALVEAFEKALEADNLDDIATLLGLDAERLRGDEATMEAYRRIRELAAGRVLLDHSGDQVILELGDDMWPFPFPIVPVEDGEWAFDTFAGLQEIVNRRVGENELEVIDSMRAFVDAQRDYAAEDRDGDGVLEFAQKIVSTPGLMDGLYWSADQGAGESPAGSLAATAAFDKAQKGEGYYGYFFRVLKGQGDNIAGGAYDYVINGNMIGGFALIAWPVNYADTGVKTFLVSHHGAVYEKNLGEGTADIVPYIESFNPDETWDIVSPGE